MANVKIKQQNKANEKSSAQASEKSAVLITTQTKAQTTTQTSAQTQTQTQAQVQGATRLQMQSETNSVEYLPRIVDRKLQKLLETFGAVEIAGTMWCGKTCTGLHFAQSVTRIAQAGPRSAAEADPSTALIGNTPHLIDEWQDVPSI